MFHSSVLAWMRLYRVVLRAERRHAIHLRSWGLNPAQFDVLAHVGAHSGITQQELANRLLVTKGNISQLLDRLEELGLLKRAQERRKNNLVLTEEGQKLYDRIVPAQEQLIQEQFAVLSSSEVADLLRIVRKLDHALR
jgi:DNA-binding MarR family transcriptional regulator